MFRTWCVLCILTSKCALRLNGTHFFDISTSKSVPTLRCFVHFDLEKCFEPQRRAGMVQATLPCGFPVSRIWRQTASVLASQFPKVVRAWCVFSILTWKRTSRHNGVQFFISHWARWLRTRRFSEPTFRPSGATHHWRKTVNRDFSTFSRACIFFLLTLSLL